MFASKHIQALVGRYGIGDLLSRNILLVDDEQPNLEVLALLLETDFHVHTANSGDEALALAEKTEMDVVITDQRMPGMTGMELLEKIHARRSDVAGIVLTGYTDPPAIIAAINQARAFRFLKKPWQADEVLEAVAQASEHVYQTRAIARLVELLAGRTEELSAAMENLEIAQRQMLQLERLSSMGRFAAGVTHDLRNAMVGLVAVEPELAELGMPEEVVDIFRVGLKGLKNLLGTLQTMHQYLRTNRLSMDRAPVPPAEVVRNAVAVVRMDMSYRDRSVRIQVDESLPEIEADAQKLVQVLVNLIRNAVQATPEHERIVIETSGSPEGDVIFAVEDEGPGVPPEMKARLFEAFVSGKGEAGLGMGLYMARLIVESHRGRISCTTGSLGGARFEVRIPPSTAVGMTLAAVGALAIQGRI